MIKEVYLLLSVRGLRMRKRLFSTSILIRISWAQVKIWSSEKPRYFTVEEWGTGTLQRWLIKISLGQGIRIWVKVVCIYGFALINFKTPFGVPIFHTAT